MGTDLLSRRDVSILKGAGILMIFLHNYLHWERGMGIENEFAFTASGFKAYLDHAFDGPLAFFRYSFAYFGHFGVQLFVLTSGYGLAVSARSKRKESYLGYLVPKLIKELKPGTRVVSHQFDMGDWKPEKRIEAVIPASTSVMSRFRSSRLGFSWPQRRFASW